MTGELPYSNQIDQIEKIEGNSRTRMLQEFKELIKEDYGFDFDIRYGELEVDNIGGFSDGNYSLENYNIQEIDGEQKIYLMNLVFEMDRKGFNYKKNINITFHYTNGNEIIINYKGDFYRVPIRSKVEYRKQRTRDGIKTEIMGKRKKIEIDDLKLILEFKTD